MDSPDAARSQPQPSKRPWSRVVAILTALLVAALVSAGWQVASWRAESRHARVSASQLDERLARLLEELPILELDGLEPEALHAVLPEIASRLDAGEFLAAPTEALGLSIRLGNAQRAAGELDAAQRRLRLALESAADARSSAFDGLLRRTPPDPDAPAAARVELARVLLAEGDATAALPLARAVIAHPNDPEASVPADRLLLMAEVLDANGDEPGAAEYAQRALESARTAEREHGQVSWSAAARLADLAARRGETSESIRLRRMALAAASQVFAPDDPRISEARYALASILHDAGPRFTGEALHEYQASLDARMARVHGDSPALTRHLANYSLLLKQAGHLRQAQPLLERALEMHRRQVAGDDASTARLLNNLGLLQLELGDRAASGRSLEEALAMRRRLFPEGNAEVAESLQNLAWWKQNAADYDGAIPLAGEAAGILRRCVTGPDLGLAIALDNFGGALTDAGRYALAEGPTREALAIESELGLGDHDARAQTLDNLAVILFHLGRFDEALQQGTAALAVRRALHGQHGPAVAQSWRHLAWIQESNGDAALAEEHYRTALAANAGSEPDPELACDISNELAALLRARGETARALREYRVAVALGVAAPSRAPWALAEATEGVASCARVLRIESEVEHELISAAEAAITAQGTPLHARARTVEALIGLYRCWSDLRAASVAQQEAARAWRERLDLADGY